MALGSIRDHSGPSRRSNCSSAQVYITAQNQGYPEAGQCAQGLSLHLQSSRLLHNTLSSPLGIDTFPCHPQPSHISVTLAHLWFCLSSQNTHCSALPSVPSLQHIFILSVAPAQRFLHLCECPKLSLLPWPMSSSALW